jgi:hypothetical protein
MTEQEAEDYIRDWSHRMVAKWNKIGLLNGLKNDIDKSPMSVLLESEPKQILDMEEMNEEEKKRHEAIMIIKKKQLEKEKSYEQITITEKTS